MSWNPLDRAARGVEIVRRVDPLSFCYQCGKDDQTLVVPAALGVRFTATGEEAAVGVCRRCRVMWSERTPSGQQIRCEIGGGKRSRSVSLPGRSTRQDIGDDAVAALLDPQRVKDLGALVHRGRRH